MKKAILPSLFGALLLNSLSAQVTSYTFSQSFKPYGATNTGTLVGTNFQDDDINLAVLPFNFKFNGVTQNTLNVSSNGFLSFSSPSNSVTTPISDNASQAIVSAFGNDLVMGTVILADLTAGSNTLTNVSSVANLSVGDSLFDYGNDFASAPTVITAIVGNSVVLNVNAINSQLAYDVIVLNGSIKQNLLGTAP
ncbi:MAG: hypothetical protein HYZ43_09340, partial [Flavobacteriia bacterium]|nr:hypothetical protein [Flavobacteriia bacterium]